MKKIFLVCFLVLLAGCSLQPSSTSENPELGVQSGDTVELREPMGQVPDFSLEDYNGNVITTESVLGDPLVVNSWASWCPFCVDEMPDFDTIKNERPDVTFVLINRQESLKKAQSFTDDLGLSDDLIFLLDPTDSFYASIGGFGMPETLFVDENGGIVEHKRGFLALEQTRERINTYYPKK